MSGSLRMVVKEFWKQLMVMKNNVRYTRSISSGKVEKVLSKVDANGKVTTYRLDSTGKIMELGHK